MYKRQDLHHYRHRRLKKLGQIGLEYALVIIQKTGAGKGQANPQDHNLHAPHKELEIKNKVADDKHQSEDGSHKPCRGPVSYTHLSVVDQIGNMVRFWRSQQIFPYRMIDEWGMKKGA